MLCHKLTSWQGGVALSVTQLLPTSHVLQTQGWTIPGTIPADWITGGIGICLGFHRHLTHMSFTTYRPVRWLLAFIGGLAGEGAVTDWVANHRKHHAHSDQEGDPHSPHDGPWWSHIFWLAFWKG